MQFTSSLIPGQLVKRYKRFLADVELADGTLVTAHCPNTGAMTGCAEPDYKVWLSKSDNPKRKLQYTWELAVDFEQNWIGVNTQNANKLVEEAIEEQLITQLAGYQNIKREVKYGSENSRIDLLLSDENKPDCYVEVKSVTLMENQQGFFPDAKTARGVKHLRELMEMVESGDRAVLFFCVQHTGIRSVTSASHIDPEYARVLQEANQKGVEILVYGSQIDQEKIVLNQELNYKS